MTSINPPSYDKKKGALSTPFLIIFEYYTFTLAGSPKVFLKAIE
jgi:hypothetical protein